MSAEEPCDRSAAFNALFMVAIGDVTATSMMCRRCVYIPRPWCSYEFRARVSMHLRLFFCMFYAMLPCYTHTFQVTTNIFDAFLRFLGCHTCWSIFDGRLIF